MAHALIAGIVVAALVSAAGLAVLVPLLRRTQVVDVPADRSLHSAPVARGGGLALVPGVLAGLVAAGLVMTGDGLPLLSMYLQVVVVLVAVLAFGLIGFSDDLFGVSAGTRLVLQVVTATALSLTLVLMTERALVWVPLLAFALVALVNITNFMDGANGLLGLHAIVAGGWYAVVGAAPEQRGTALFALVLVGAVLGFLPFNLPRARVFLGDVGSYALGGAWGMLAAWLLLAGEPVEVVTAPLLVFAADTAYTLQLRLRAGQRWYQPHKLHVYQRLVSAGWPHAASSALVAGVALVCSALAVPALLGAGTPVRLLCLLGMAVVCAVYLRLPVWLGAPEPWHVARVALPR